MPKEYKTQDELIFESDLEKYKHGLRLECLKLVLEHGMPNDKAQPWNRAEHYFHYIFSCTKPKT